MDICRTFEREGHHPAELIRIIGARYRNNGYEINWLLFSQECELKKPDLTTVPSYWEIKDDRILVAGVSFKKHLSEKVYADSNYVLDQLPPHQKLVIGGFHQGDCVDKVARTSYQRGIETFVDEDTTELFFGKQAFGGVPLVRERWGLRELGVSDRDYEWVKEQRQGKPWLTQE